MTVQLRRYEVEPGRLGELVEWFPAIVPVREKFGFTVDFAYADHENSQFVWAVSYDGSVEEFEAAVEVYNASPERAAAFAGVDSPGQVMHVGYVDAVG